MKTFDLGNVLSNVESIKGMRLQNQLGQQQLDAKNMLIQQRAQFSPLYNNFLQNPTQEAFNELASASPQLAQEALGMVSQFGEYQGQQHQLSAAQAAQDLVQVQEAIASPNTKAWVYVRHPDFVKGLEQQGLVWNDLSEEQVDQMAQGLVKELEAIIAQSGRQRPAELQVRDALYESFTPEERARADRIDRGLEPRAASPKTVGIGGVKYAHLPDGSYAPIKIAGDEITPEDQMDTEAKLAERKAQGTETGKFSARIVSEGIDGLSKVRSNIRTLDLAVKAIDEGANTGAIARRFPDFFAGSVKLSQIQQQLGLDIVGMTTFGQLSKGELDLALNTALPTGLNQQELRQWVLDKKAAQEKVAKLFEQQIRHFEGGGSASGWLDIMAGDMGVSDMSVEQLKLITGGGQ